MIVVTQQGAIISTNPMYNTRTLPFFSQSEGWVGTRGTEIFADFFTLRGEKRVG